MKHNNLIGIIILKIIFSVFYHVHGKKIDAFFSLTLTKKKTNSQYKILSLGTVKIRSRYTMLWMVYERENTNLPLRRLTSTQKIYGQVFFGFLHLFLKRVTRKYFVSSMEHEFQTTTNYFKLQLVNILFSTKDICYIYMLKYFLNFIP